MFKKILILIILATACLYALPKKIQADRYLLEAKKSVENKNHKKAIEYFKKILDLNIEVPNLLHYHYAKSLIEKNYYKDCLNHLDIFLTNGGDQTKYYTKALNIYNKCESEFSNYEKKRLKAEKELKIKKEKELKRISKISKKGFDSGEITYQGLIYKLIKSPHTGRIWLDRNIGAVRTCKAFNDNSCYGNYYNYKEAMNICPNEFYLPSKKEFINETINIGMQNNIDAYNLFLKFPSAGQHNRYSNRMDVVGITGNVLTSSSKLIKYKYSSENMVPVLYFYDSRAGFGHEGLVNGYSVRCIKKLH